MSIPITIKGIDSRDFQITRQTVYKLLVDGILRKEGGFRALTKDEWKMIEGEVTMLLRNPSPHAQKLLTAINQSYENQA